MTRAAKGAWTHRRDGAVEIGDRQGAAELRRAVKLLQVVLEELLVVAAGVGRGAAAAVGRTGLRGFRHQLKHALRAVDAELLEDQRKTVAL